MFLDTQPAALASSGGIDPYAEFRINHSREIAGLLKQLAADATPVVLSGPNAAGLTTVIWTVDSAQQRINFSADPDSPQLQRLIELEEATCVAYLDSVKLQFDVDHLVLVRGNKTCSLQADMPREMYRFQRRRSFRVRTLGRGTPTALLRHPSMPDM
ncbi:MAG TPA: flagellar regulator YcgR PilZN domain-containing protein, partial [Burkholderiaceae bacterium]|nr:flagellar regulator YcgR PilZN domain-containing protein [Burkholderiaceae bacterium]